MGKTKLTRKTLTELLDQDDMKSISAFGKDALPLLASLAQDSDVLLAAKAIRAVGEMGLDESVKILDSAARSRNRVVRVAAAIALGNLGAAGEDTLAYLLQSTDASVRKWAILSADKLHCDSVKKSLHRIVEKDPIESLRKSAAKILRSKPS